MEQIAQERPEPGPDLGNRSLTAAGAPRTNGEGAGDDLHQGNTRADPAMVKVIRSDGRIGSVSLGFRKPG